MWHTIRSLIIAIVLSNTIMAQLVSFEGIGYIDKTPADPTIAVGPQEVVLVVNSKVAIYTKTGLLVSEESLTDFFGFSLSGAPFDPKIIYDHNEGRFILVALSNRTDGEVSEYLIAVSSTSSATDSWFKRKENAMSYEGAHKYYADYPGLGYDQDNVYITTKHYYYYNNTVQYSNIHIIKKSELYSPGVINSKNIIVRKNPGGQTVEVLRPVQKFGQSTKMYFVSSNLSNNPNSLAVWRLSNPWSVNPELDSVNIPVGTYETPGEAKQKGFNSTVNIGDCRVSDVVFRSPYLYGAFTVKRFDGDGSNIRYFKINVDNYNLAINDSIYGQAGVYYYFPAICPDNEGNILIVYNRSSSNDYIGMAVSYHMSGALTATGSRWVKKGEGYYYHLHQDGRNRWGDYSGIALDPSDGMKIWVYGMYATPDYLKWGTFVAAMSPNISVQVSNIIEEQNAGGSIRINDNIQINSGEEVLLKLESNNLLITNNERFVNWQSSGNYKHNNWNDLKNSYFLGNVFSPGFQSNNHQKANFKKLDFTKINLSFEGSLFQNQGSFEFQDPWYVKADGTQPGDYWIPCTGSYEPTGKEGASEKGVFLNQYPTGGDPHYSVKTITPQEVTVNNSIHKLHFQNWVSNTVNGSPAAEFQDPNSLTTGVVFKSAGAEVIAVMKGTHLTNSNVALAQTGSRNIIREHYTGHLYLTYQSMDCIWLEKSTDNGTTWSLANGGKAISKVMAKNPAISILGSYAVITYQKLFESSSSGVMAKLYDLNTDIVTDSATIYSHSSLTMSDNLNPVVECIVGCNRIVVVYTNPVQINNFDIPGLYIDNIGIVWDSGQNRYRFSGVNGSTEYDTYITGTNTASVNPALSYRPGNSSNILHLVWQQSDITTGDEIMYVPVEFLSNGSINSIGEITCISSGCGYDQNINPTVTSIPGDDIPRVGWVGHRTGIEGEYGAINKPQANNSTLTTENATEAVFRALDNNTSWSYGTDVRYVNINRTESVNGYALAWTQGIVPPFENKYFKNTAFYNEYPLTTTGGEIQLTNALNFTGMFGLSLNTAAQPYRFEQTNLIEAPAKEQYAERTAMRSGIIYNRKAQIVFSFGNIKVNNEPVLFPLIAEGVSVNSLERVNQYLLSDEFTLTDNSVFQYSINYRVTDTVNAVTALGTNGEVGFTLKLEDANTGEILGEYDRVTYNAHNVKQYARIDYQVNPEGIGNRTVRLRLTATTNTEMQAGLNTRVKRDNRLGKGLYKEISYKGGAVIKEYALSQNYPNPFNPSTSIRYQIPNAGNVKLVVYDVLGKEVATLVNKEQAPGSYTVTFDGSKLASGVYIYKLTAGNYTATKKLNLLK